MWDPRHLTTLQAPMDCYRDKFNLPVIYKGYIFAESGVLIVLSKKLDLVHDPIKDSTYDYIRKLGS
jgi:hypothetical protein